MVEYTPASKRCRATFEVGRSKIVKEAKVTSEPEALVYFFKGLGFAVNRIGFEVGPLGALSSSPMQALQFSAFARGEGG